MKQQLGIWGRFLRGNVAVLMLGAILTGSLFALSPVAWAEDPPAANNDGAAPTAKLKEIGGDKGCPGGEQGPAIESGCPFLMQSEPKAYLNIPGKWLYANRGTAFWTMINNMPTIVTCEGGMSDDEWEGCPWGEFENSDEGKEEEKINGKIIESQNVDDFIKTLKALRTIKYGKDATPTKNAENREALLTKELNYKIDNGKLKRGDNFDKEAVRTKIRGYIREYTGDVMPGKPSMPDSIAYYALHKAAWTCGLGDGSRSKNLLVAANKNTTYSGDKKVTVAVASVDEPGGGVDKPVGLGEFGIKLMNGDNQRFVGFIKHEFTFRDDWPGSFKTGESSYTPNTIDGTNVMVGPLPEVGKALGEKDISEETDLLGSSGVLDKRNYNGSATCEQVVEMIQDARYAKAFLLHAFDQPDAITREWRDRNKNKIWEASKEQGGTIAAFKKEETKCWDESKGKKVKNDITGADEVRRQDSKEVAQDFLKCLQEKLQTDVDTNPDVIDSTQADINRDIPPPAAPDNGDTDDDGDGKPTCDLSFGIGWLICPITNFLAGITDNAYKIVSWMLDYNMMRDTDARNQMYDSWTKFRNLANIAFVIVFLIVIFSQVSNIALDNYAIKRMMPRLVVGAILVNVSFWVCGVAVDVSNILGNTLAGALKETAPSITFGSFFDQALAGTLVIAGLAAAAAIGAMAIGMPVLLGALVAIATTFLILVLRQALITILIIISPIAFVANLLPNTESWFKKWQKMFTGLLLVFPAIAILFGGSQFASRVFLSLDNNGAGAGLWMLIGLGIMMIPLFLTLKVIQAISQMGSMGDMVGKMTGKGINGAHEKYKGSTLGQARARNKEIRTDQIHQGKYSGKNPFHRARNSLNKSLNDGSLGKGLNKVSDGEYTQQRGRNTGKKENEFIQKKSEQFMHDNKAGNRAEINTLLDQMNGTNADGTRASEHEQDEARQLLQAHRLATARSQGHEAAEALDEYIVANNAPSYDIATRTVINQRGQDFVTQIDSTNTAKREHRERTNNEQAAATATAFHAAGIQAHNAGGGAHPPPSQPHPSPSTPPPHGGQGGNPPTPPPGST